MSQVLLSYIEKTEKEMQEALDVFLHNMRNRRSVRDFSNRPVPKELIEKAIRVASLAPSGANQQPWTFVVISQDEHKQRLRLAAEKEEQAFYAGRAGEEWLSALSHLGTNASKPHLTDAPYIVVLFAQKWGIDDNGKKVKHYYASESVGIAAGFFITALHLCGLVTLTHTPAPMGFLNQLCGRPEHEKPMLLFPVGYPKDPCYVPDISKKNLEQVLVWL